MIEEVIHRHERSESLLPSEQSERRKSTKRLGWKVVTMPSKIDIIASQRFQDGDLEILGIHVAKNSNRRV